MARALRTSSSAHAARSPLACLELYSEWLPNSHLSRARCTGAEVQVSVRGGYAHRLSGLVPQNLIRELPNNWLSPVETVNCVAFLKINSRNKNSFSSLPSAYHAFDTFKAIYQPDLAQVSMVWATWARQNNLFILNRIIILKWLRWRIPKSTNRTTLSLACLTNRYIKSNICFAVILVLDSSKSHRYVSVSHRSLFW